MISNSNQVKNCYPLGTSSAGWSICEFWLLHLDCVVVKLVSWKEFYWIDELFSRITTGF